MHLGLAVPLSLVLLASPALGAVAEKALPPEAKKPLAIAFDSSGQMWLTLDETWALARYDTVSGKLDLARITVPRSGEGDSLTALAIAPDGSAWSASNAYLHHAHAGNLSVESFHLPEPTELSGGVYVAPGGSVWVSGVTTDELLRFDPATGRFAEHAAPATPFGPLHIEPGPRGVYLTATYAHTYATLDAGTGSVVPAPSGILDAPVGLDVTPTSLWAGEMGSDNVGHVDLATGRVEHFPTSPSPYYQISGPAGIRVARDGSVWFVEHFADKIARLDPANRTLQEWEAPSAPGTNMQYLAEAPDGTFWFAEWSANKLGHATADSTQPAFTLPAAAQILVGQSLRVPLSVPAQVIVNGHGNLTARWDGGAVVLDATTAPAGTYNVLVASKEGKTTLGRYLTVQVEPGKDSPGFDVGLVLGAGLLLAALRRRRP